MKVSRVDIFLVEVPLRRSFRSSSSTTGSVLHPLVRLVGDNGREGWGEAPTPVDPYYLGETPASAWDILASYLAPQIIGLDWQNPVSVARACSRVKGNPVARSAMEMAAWDLWCRTEGVSLAGALASTSASEPLPTPSLRIPAGASIGLEDDLTSILDRVDDCVAAGYRRVKLKIAPGSDIPVVAAVRERYPDLVLVADANGAYVLSDPRHRAALADLDRMGMAAIEQPLADDDLIGHARLSKTMTTPIALDEAIASGHALESAIALEACRAVSLKAPRLGGLSAALDVLAVCRERRIDAWCGGLHELGIGRSANVALASMTGFTLPGDMAGSSLDFDDDLVEPGIAIEEGFIPVPTGPGLGVEVQVDRVEARAVRLASID